MKAETKEISTNEYATLRGILPQTVRNNIKKGYTLPFVISYYKKGRDWFFTVKVEDLKK